MKKVLIVLLTLVAGFAVAQDEIRPQDKIVTRALNEVGVYKMPGSSDARVRQYVEETGNPIEMYQQDGWCSSFVAWVLKKEGYEYSAYPTMDEWLYCGVVTDDPQPGDIVLLPGHIAFFNGFLALPGFAKRTIVDILGGNQAHRVCDMPIGESWIRFYLHPVKAPDGWQPRKHFGWDLSSTENRLDDKTNIMSVMEYQFHPEKDSRVSTTPDY